MVFYNTTGKRKEMIQEETVGGLDNIQQSPISLLTKPFNSDSKVSSCIFFMSNHGDSLCKHYIYRTLKALCVITRLPANSAHLVSTASSCQVTSTLSYNAQERHG